jgi:MoaA/NifB/PqqE/SkfB family radical SAM enzyme
MCPRFSSEDPHLDLSPNTFERIGAAMKYAHTVDFTGWGEPLLHKRIYEMIQVTKTQGCVATMTSNGTALNERNCLRLLEAGLDRLVVSVDGLRAETYSAIRVGADLERVSNNLESLAQLIESSSSQLDVGVAFTIQEGNMDDLPLILPWLESVGARTLHLKHLNVVSHLGDWENSFLKYVLPPFREDPQGRLTQLEDGIRQLWEQGAARGVNVMMHSEFPLDGEMQGRHCLATPIDSVYFSHDGKVSPCCHFGHHVSRFFEGDFYPPSALFFGDIRKESFEEIWLSPAFAAFRKGFQTRDFPDACRTCYLLYGK